MPKLKVVEGLTLYLLEIFLLILFPALIIKIKYRIQLALLGFWFFILFATISSQFFVVDIGGLARVIKGFLYIPLFAIGVYHYKELHLKWFLNIFLLASFFNVMLLIHNITMFGFNIWDVKTISSGLSNRYFSIVDFSFGTIESGAHGIWGNYCVLAVLVSLYLRFKRMISNALFVSVLLFALVGLGMSVSREAIITLFMVMAGLVFFGLKSLFRLRLNMVLAKWAMLCFVFISLIVLFFGDNIPIIQKVVYTVDSFESQGSEGNIQLRINGWKVFFESLYINPEKLLTGYGFNQGYYISHIDFAYSKYRNAFVALPESFFVMALSFGGLLSFLCSIWFFIEIFKIVRRIRDNLLRFLVIGYFFGLLFGNVFAGASIIADLLYGQLMIFFGFIFVYGKEAFIVYNSQK